MEDAKLAKALSDPTTRKDTAAKILRLDPSKVPEARSLSSNGTESFSLQALGIKSKELLDKFLRWQGLSKEERVNEMLTDTEQYIEQGDSPKGFFNGVYTRYLRFKKKNGSKWKDESYQLHLSKLKSVVDRCVVTDSMSMDDFHKICIYGYFAIKTKFFAKAGTEPKMATINPIELKKAA